LNTGSPLASGAAVIRIWVAAAIAASAASNGTMEILRGVGS
jgi:hypothetical protein